MAKVEKATVAMFDDVYPLLTEFNDPNLTREKWQRIFNYPWRSDGDEIGYVLTDNGKIVGFIGTIYSRRLIDGKPTRFCNTTSWIVKEEYRLESLRLLFPVLRMKDCTLTNHTSSPKVCEIMRQLKFKELETRLRLIFPGPEPSRMFRQEPAVITSDRGKIAGLLNRTDRQILTDHSDYNCGHVVVEEEGGYSYILFTKKHRKQLGLSMPYAHVHYISDREIFLKHLPRIKRHFLTAHKCCFLAVEERLIGHQPLPFSKGYELKVPRFFKSDTVAGEQIDNLYSEMVVLGL